MKKSKTITEAEYVELLKRTKNTHLIEETLANDKLCVWAIDIRHIPNHIIGTPPPKKHPKTGYFEVLTTKRILETI